MPETSVTAIQTTKHCHNCQPGYNTLELTRLQCDFSPVLKPEG